MQTLGIDLSTDPKKVWTCEVDWGQSPPRITALDRMSSQPDPLGESSGLIRTEASLIAELVARMAAFSPSADRVVGVDAPLGWPAAFVQAICDWDDGDLEGFRKRPDLRLRATDRFVQLVARVTPMSVSTDRMGSTAMLLAEVLSRVARGRDHQVFDRATGCDGVAEVHPSAAMRLWTLGGEPLSIASYKGWYVPRFTIVMRLARAGFEITPQQAQAMVDHDDALDAFICALVARAVALGACVGVEQTIGLEELLPKANRGTASDEELAARLEQGRAIQSEASRTAGTEGWIHLPVRSDLAVALGTTPGTATWVPEPQRAPDPEPMVYPDRDEELDEDLEAYYDHPLYRPAEALREPLQA